MEPKKVENDDDLELGQFDFKSKKTCCEGELVQKSLEIAYDIFTVVVSLLDVITDVMVLTHFYSSDRMTFFYISLTILIIAQLAYTMAFWWKFTGNTFGSAATALFACCCLLPLSPILSYAFYFTSNETTALYKFFDRLFNFECKMECCRSNTTNQRSNDNNKQHALRQWVEDKLMKHLGFIIEALIEAFPQSILQLIAIVYYNDTHNYVSILSIFLSMISVSTKSFILSVKVSYNWKSALFIWVSCLIDFVAIFCIVSLIFYVPPSTSHDPNPFEILQQVWLYSSCITVVPFTFIGSTVLMCSYLFDNPECDFDWCVALFLIVTLWIIGLCVTTMVMTIAGFAVFALLLIRFGPSKRLPSGDFYMPLVSFIRHAKSVHVRDFYEEEAPLRISKNQHKIIRTCCINRVLLETMEKPSYMLAYAFKNQRNTKALTYLKEKSVAKKNGDIPYINATFEGIQQHSHTAADMKRIRNKCVNCCDLYKTVPEYFYGEFTELSEHNICGLAALYCCLPLYFVGRCFNTLFIFFMICYLYIGFDINVFSDDIPSFQTVMVSCYLGLVGLWIILLYWVRVEQYYLSFILPSVAKLTSDPNRNDTTTERIMNYYHSVISQLVAQRYCVRIFGKDVAMIIMELWGSGNYHFN